MDLREEALQGCSRMGEEERRDPKVVRRSWLMEPEIGKLK